MVSKFSNKAWVARWFSRTMPVRNKPRLKLPMTAAAVIPRMAMAMTASGKVLPQDFLDARSNLIVWTQCPNDEQFRPAL